MAEITRKTEVQQRNHIHTGHGPDGVITAHHNREDRIAVPSADMWNMHISQGHTPFHITVIAEV